MGRYQEALEITEEGLLTSMESARYHEVASLLWVQAYCRYCMGEREKCISLYRQVHYMLAATRNMAWLRYLDEENKKILGIEFPD